MTVKEGEGVELICTSTTEALGCLFKSPTGVSYNMLKGATFEQGRIAQQERNPEDCAMKIDQITESDNGEWECSVTVKGPTGDYDIGNGQVQVVVAVPPSEVIFHLISFEFPAILATLAIFCHFTKKFYQEFF